MRAGDLEGNGFIMLNSLSMADFDFLLLPGEVFGLLEDFGELISTQLALSAECVAGPDRAPPGV